MPKTVLRLTAHYLDDYEACPLYFNRIVNLKRGEPSKPAKLAKGSGIHLVLKYYYLGVKAAVPFDDNVSEAIKKFETEAMSINGLVVEDIDKIISTFSEYTAWYRDRDKFDILSVEEPLSSVLYEDDNLVILYEGTQDLNVLTSEGIVMPYDHKSEASRYTPSGLSNQFIGYCYLTKGNRMMRNAIGFQTSKGPGEKFYRTMFSYSNEKIEWWKQETIKKAFRIMESYKKNEWTPNLSACDMLHRGGCPFRPVCLEGEGMWEVLLEKDYVHVELYDKR